LQPAIGSTTISGGSSGMNQKPVRFFANPYEGQRISSSGKLSCVTDNLTAFRFKVISTRDSFLPPENRPPQK
jgi:hypothetical protein